MQTLLHLYVGRAATLQALSTVLSVVRNRVEIRLLRPQHSSVMPRPVPLHLQELDSLSLFHRLQNELVLLPIVIAITTLHRFLVPAHRLASLHLMLLDSPSLNSGPWTFLPAPAQSCPSHPFVRILSELFHS